MAGRLSDDASRAAAEARRLEAIAEASAEAEDPGSAVAAFSEAASLYRFAGLAADESACLVAVAEALAQGGQHGPAADRIAEALKLARALGEPRTLADTLEVAARLASWAARVEEARGHYGEAARFYADEPDIEGFARCRIGLAECLVDLGRHPAAEELLAPIVETPGSLEDDEALARTLALLAAFALARGEVAEAAPHWEQAARLHDEALPPQALARAAVRCAQAARAGRSYDAAVNLLAVAEARFRAVDSVGDAATTAFRLAQAAAADESQLPVADEAVGRAIADTSALRDLAGLRAALEFGIELAVRMQQPWLTVERVRALVGLLRETDEPRPAVDALAFAVGVANLRDRPERAALALELADAFDTLDPNLVDHDWVARTARLLDDADLPERALSAAAARGAYEASAGRPHLAAALYAQAAGLAVRTGDGELAASLYERAIDDADPRRDERVAGWRERLAGLRGS